MNYEIMKGTVFVRMFVNGQLVGTKVKRNRRVYCVSTRKQGWRMFDNGGASRVAIEKIGNMKFRYDKHLVTGADTDALKQELQQS